MYQVRDACYPTAAEAASVSSSSLVGGVVVIGANTYTVNVVSTSGTVINYQFTPVGGGAVINQAAAYTAQPCALLTIADGLEMGWAVGAAWIGAYALLFITRALRGETGGDYGNA